MSSHKFSKKPKDYSRTTRVYDADGYRLRADTICFRDITRQEVLMVSSRNTEGGWTLPGGGLEPNETPVSCAIREVMEEAGVTGNIVDYVGVYYNHESKARTDVFIMVFRGEVDSWEDRTEIGRQRRWFDVESSIALMARKPLKQKYLKDACSDGSPSPPPPPPSTHLSADAALHPHLLPPAGEALRQPSLVTAQSNS